jgi:hypothetical protein|tara:strand:+ start:411 stop:716 length:306 start_codon:yes stop_codon:yes gene_type:complete
MKIKHQHVCALGIVSNILNVYIPHIFSLNVKHMFKNIFFTLIIIFSLESCTRSSYMTSTKNIKGTLVQVIMPEQKCNKRDMGRVLVGEKVLHPAHKECYYN